MNRKPDPEVIDDDNPEWTDETAKRSFRLDQMPDEFQAMVKRTRGPQKAPTKRQLTMRLSADVVDAFKATGQGWQTRIDDALRDWLQTHKA